MAKETTATVENNETVSTENTQAEVKQLSDEKFKEFKNGSYATEEELNRPYQTHTSLQGQTISGIIPLDENGQPMKYRRADGTESDRSYAFLWEKKDRNNIVRQKATHLTGAELEKIISKTKSVPAPDNEDYSEAAGGAGVRIQFAQQSGEVLA